MTSAVPEVPPVPEVPAVPPLRRAARGLGQVFVATALTYITFVSQVVLLLILHDTRWLLIPLGVYVLLDLLGLSGRWLCLKAKASRQTKTILRLSMLVTFLALLVDLALAIAGGLEVFQLIPPNNVTPHVLPFLKYLALLSPALDILATVLFLFYIRGLGIALEHYEFGADAMGIVGAGVLVYLLGPPLLYGILWTGYFTHLMEWEDVLFLLGLPFLMLAAFLLAVYPFVLYCNLLTRMRDSILWQLENEAALKPRRHHHKPPG